MARTDNPLPKHRERQLWMEVVPQRPRAFIESQFDSGAVDHD